MKTTFSIFLSIFLLQNIHAQKTVQKDCTRTLTKEGSYVIEEKTHYVFTGTDTTGLMLKTARITVMEGRQELVKRKKSKDCVSPNPSDCIIEVWEEIPPVTMNLLTLSGPDITDEYEIRTEKVKKTVGSAQNTEVQVLCTENRSKELVEQLQKALSRAGYTVKTSGIVDESTLSAVTAFQKSRGMAFGDITLEVLKVLGVDK
jgi:hypothetical protein